MFAFDGGRVRGLISKFGCIIKQPENRHRGAAVTRSASRRELHCCNDLAGMRETVWWSILWLKDPGSNPGCGQPLVFFVPCSFSLPTLYYERPATGYRACFLISVIANQAQLAIFRFLVLLSLAWFLSTIHLATFGALDGPFTTHKYVRMSFVLCKSCLFCLAGCRSWCFGLELPVDRGDLPVEMLHKLCLDLAVLGSDCCGIWSAIYHEAFR